MKIFDTIIFISLFVVGCKKLSDQRIEQAPIISITYKTPKEWHYIPFERDSIVAAHKRKSENDEPIVVHIFVPLCDNQNQGIVPVNAQLGDGQNLKTNLYWGARYGMRSFFKLEGTWKLLNTFSAVDSNVLERVVFTKTIGISKVIIVADAYRGDRMRPCLTDFFYSVAQLKYDSILLPDASQIKIASGSDLLIFNGHNGLMDTWIDTVENQTNIRKDVAVIGCVSYDYFSKLLNYAGGYPLLTTNQLLAPEAYCVNALINQWALFATGDEIVNAVAADYAIYQKCSFNGAKAIFRTGW